MSAFTATGATQGEVKGLYSKIKKNIYDIKFINPMKENGCKNKRKETFGNFCSNYENLEVIY